MLNTKTIFHIFVSIFFISSSQYCFAAEKPIIELSFDEWEWLPISPNMATGLKKLIKDGEDINIENRGPLYRKFKGLYDGGISGRMVEGEEAFKGKAVRFNNTSKKNPLVIGLHAPFNGLLTAGKTYHYDFWLKGEGVFIFRAWVNGINTKTSQSKWLGFPDLIKVKATPEWKRIQGLFVMPQFKDETYAVEKHISCAIVVPTGSRIYVDEFRIDKKR